MIDLEERVHPHLRLTSSGFGQSLGTASDPIFAEVLLFAHELDQSFFVRFRPLKTRQEIKSGTDQATAGPWAHSKCGAPPGSVH